MQNAHLFISLMTSHRTRKAGIVETRGPLEDLRTPPTPQYRTQVSAAPYSTTQYMGTWPTCLCATITHAPSASPR